MLSHEGSYDQHEGSESGYQNSARGFDRPNQNVFDLSMDYSDDEVLLDWEQYAGAGHYLIDLCSYAKKPDVMGLLMCCMVMYRPTLNAPCLRISCSFIWCAIHTLKNSMPSWDDLHGACLSLLWY